MQRRPLGTTGRLVSVIGLGGAGLGGVYGAITDDQAVETVSCALARGVDFIDTAPLYGVSEERLGLALAGRREQVFLATKVGLLRGGARITAADDVRRSVADSLRRLRTDYLDLLQYHELQPDIAAAVLADGGAVEAMVRLREEGVVRHLGVTGRQLGTLCDALRTEQFATVLTYLEYSPLTLAAQDALFPLAASLGVGLIAGSPLGAGLLAGADLSSLSRPLDDPALRRAHAVSALAAQAGWSVPDLAIAFELADPRVSVLIPGANSPDQVAAAVAAAGRRVPFDLLERVRAIAVS